MGLLGVANATGEGWRERNPTSWTGTKTRRVREQRQEAIIRTRLLDSDNSNRRCQTTLFRSGETTNLPYQHQQHLDTKTNGGNQQPHIDGNHVTDCDCTYPIGPLRRGWDEQFLGVEEKRAGKSKTCQSNQQMSEPQQARCLRAKEDDALHPQTQQHKQCERKIELVPDWGKAEERTKDKEWNLHSQQSAETEGRTENETSRGWRAVNLGLQRGQRPRLPPVEQMETIQQKEDNYHPP